METKYPNNALYTVEVAGIENAELIAEGWEVGMPVRRSCSRGARGAPTFRPGLQAYASAEEAEADVVERGGTLLGVTFIVGEFCRRAA